MSNFIHPCQKSVKVAIDSLEEELAVEVGHVDSVQVDYLNVLEPWTKDVLWQLILLQWLHIQKHEGVSMYCHGGKTLKSSGKVSIVASIGTPGDWSKLWKLSFKMVQIVREVVKSVSGEEVKIVSE